jgi:hypothetical protein
VKQKVQKLSPVGVNLEHNNETNTIALTAKKSGIWAGLTTLNFCRVNWGVFTIFLTRIESRDPSISYTAYLTIFQNSIREFD